MGPGQVEHLGIVHLNNGRTDIYSLGNDTKIILADEPTYVDCDIYELLLCISRQVQTPKA